MATDVQVVTGADGPGWVVTEPRRPRILELRYGTIRAQALPPRESLEFIERVRGEA